MSTLGIDLAVRAAHVATLADDRGEVIWSRRRFQSHPRDLAAVSAAAGPASELTVVMEPTRSSWVMVAAHFRAAGAKVVMVAPEKSADLRKYYKKHTKNDRLDSFVLSRVPLLHPEGLIEVSGLGPADPLKRAVRRRVRLVEQRHACHQRIDAMLDLLGPAYNEALGTRGTKTAAAVLERYGNPKTLRRLGISRLTDLSESSGGNFGRIRRSPSRGRNRSYRAVEGRRSRLRGAGLGPRPGDSNHQTARGRDQPPRCPDSRAI